MLTLQEIKFSTSIYYQTFTNHSITYLIQYYNCKIFKNIFCYYFGSLKELSIQKVIPVLSSEYIWIKKSTILLHSLQLIVNHIDKHNKQKKPDNKWTLNSIIRAVASLIIGGGADIHIYMFTHHNNNRFQKQLIVQNTNI